MAILRSDFAESDDMRPSPRLELGAMTRAMILIALVSLMVAPRARAGKDTGPSAVLNFVVVRDYNGKPVRNAAVVVHSVGKNDKQGAWRN